MTPQTGSGRARSRTHYVPAIVTALVVLPLTTPGLPLLVERHLGWSAWVSVAVLVALGLVCGIRAGAGPAGTPATEAFDMAYTIALIATLFALARATEASAGLVIGLALAVVVPLHVVWRLAEGARSLPEFFASPSR